MAMVNKWLLKGCFPVLGMSFLNAVISWCFLSPAHAEGKFKDIDGHWAQSCIEELGKRQIIGGYQDGTFRPEEAMMRVEFAVLLDKAFPNSQPLRDGIQFVDIPTDYWATGAIARMYRANFISGYSGSIFNPTQKILRLQALLALVSGLRYSATAGTPALLDRAFVDSGDIPGYARDGIAAAVEKRLVVNYPEVNSLKPNQEATRAEVASFICQALSGGRFSGVPERYIAQFRPVETVPETTKRQIVESGNVRAEFLFEVQDVSLGLGKNFRLKINRKGDTLLDEPILISTRGLVDSPDGSDRRLSEGRFLGLEVRDLDGDGEMEVILDLISTNSGARCCSYTYIYRYEPADNKYNYLQQFWANVGYQVRDIEGDGIPEFDSLDSRFTFALDIPYSDVRFPKRIWHYKQGRMIDLTRNYPQVVKEQTQALWQEFQERRNQKLEVRGVLAAYLANKYLLGEEDEGWQLVEKVYQGSDRQQYFQDLRKIYRDLGYTNNRG